MKKLMVVLICLFCLSGVQVKAQTTLKEYDHPNGRRVVMVNFNKDVSSEFAIKEIQSLNLKPANLEDLESFLANIYDQSLKDATIVAIGSSWQTVVSTTVVPYSCKGSSFNLQSTEEKWGTGSLFMTFSSRNLTTDQIDAVYEKAPFIVNSLKKEKQIITYDKDSRIHLFTGKADANIVNMCTVEMPKIMDSQMISTQLVVNGRQEFDFPIKLSYQVYDNPKYINGKIVVRAHNPGKTHFYAVVNPNGSGYDTEVK